MGMFAGLFRGKKRGTTGEPQMPERQSTVTRGVQSPSSPPLSSRSGSLSAGEAVAFSASAWAMNLIAEADAAVDLDGSSVFPDASPLPADVKRGVVGVIREGESPADIPGSCRQILLGQPEISVASNMTVRFQATGKVKLTGDVGKLAYAHYMMLESVAKQRDVSVRTFRYFDSADPSGAHCWLYLAYE